MPVLAPTANPIRNLADVAEELRVKNVNASTHFVNDSNVLDYSAVSRGDGRQLVEDLKRFGGKFYFNGKSLAEIIRQEKINGMADRLKKFTTAPDHNAERNEVVQELYQFYLSSSKQTKPSKFSDLTPAQFTQFIEYYTEHDDEFDEFKSNYHAKLRYPLYLTLTGKTAPMDYTQLSSEELQVFRRFYVNNANLFNNVLNNNNWMLKLDREFIAGLEDFYNHKDDIVEYWQNVLKRELFADLGEEQQQAMLNFMKLYAHQGGIMYAPATMIMNAFSTTGQYHGLEGLNVDNENHLHATFEFTVKEGRLEIREISQLTKIGYGMDRASDVMDNRIFDWQNQEMGRLLDYQVKHVVSYNPEAADKFDVTTQDDESFIYSYDEDFWEVAQKKLVEAKRLDQMAKALKEYAEYYLKNGHDNDKANKLIHEYPEILKSNPSNQLGLFSNYFPNKSYSIFYTLNKVSSTFASTIVSNFNKIVKEGLKPFTHAMKLLQRLGHKKEALDLLKPYNDDNLAADVLLDPKSFQNLHPRIAEAIAREDIIIAAEKDNALQKEQKTQATAAAMLREKHYYPKSFTENIPTTPIRDLSAIAADLAKEGLATVVIEKKINGVLIKPETYADGHGIKQVNRDFIPNQGRTYFDGMQVKEIVEQVRVSHFKDELQKFLIGDAKQLSALQSFYDFYNIANGQPLIPINKKNFQAQIDKMARYYRENSKTYDDVLVKTPNSDLNSLIKTLSVWNYEVPEKLETGLITQSIFTDYFLKHINSSNEKAALLAGLTKYTHQGGYTYTAYTAVSEALAFTSKVIGINSWVPQDSKLHTTFEYKAIPGGLQIREVTPITELHNEDKNGNVSVKKMSTPGANLIEFETVHELIFDASQADKFKLSVKSAKAHVNDPESWNFISRKVDQLNRFRKMQVALTEYAQSYLRRGHDADMAKAIFIIYPEIKDYTESDKQLKEGGFSSLFGAKAKKPNDRLLLMFGKIERGLGGQFVNELLATGDHLGNEKKYTKTMKLLVAMQVDTETLELFKPPVVETTKISKNSPSAK